MKPEFIEKLIQEEKQELGASYVDVRPVLERTLTAGELLEALKGVDPNLPLVLEIAVGATGAGQDRALSLDSAYLLNVFETGDQTPRLVLSGCVPEVVDFYVESEGL